jgi:hypothetical protein
MSATWIFGSSLIFQAPASTNLQAAFHGLPLFMEQRIAERECGGNGKGVKIVCISESLVLTSPAILHNISTNMQRGNQYEGHILFQISAIISGTAKI